MAAQKTHTGIPSKRKGKKRQSRTEVSSSSESDSESDVLSSKSRKSKKPVENVTTTNNIPRPILMDVKEPSLIPEPSAKKSKKKSTSTDSDTPMTDAPESSPVPTSKKSKAAASQPQDDFSAIYLRKIAAELADDVDKVREAQDFKANSVPMLIHALKQGESMFSAEEKRRVVAAAGQ
ncbi:ribosome-assembly protein 3-domain-containing protein [Ampelomyces quisqualis]|uniref:Ribosome assembly protein 3 n=1 Tax=Ampelomyces quisqualis TaxID=50730 RepID=A0A6A5QY21_AMPQU|nr:ribosome-assembly protein 3-domain-containing protein [Ampelomyces quisqualis]